MAAPIKNELKELMAKKDAIEEEIKELTSVLETVRKCDITENIFMINLWLQINSDHNELKIWT